MAVTRRIQTPLEHRNGVDGGAEGDGGGGEDGGVTVWIGINGGSIVGSRRSHRPVVWSGEPGVPLKSEEGRKRSLVVLARKRGVVVVRPEVAMSVQEEDPSACHCQVP